MMFLIWYFIFFFCISAKVSQGKAVPQWFQLSAPNSYMDNNIVVNISNLSLTRCAISCTKYPDLKSFNYNKVNGRCELIQTSSLASLRANNNYTYYTKVTKPLQSQKPDPCQSQPCTHGRNCSLMSDGLNYQCSECPYPLNGTNCDSLVSELCVKSSDTVYCALDLPSENWNISYAKCVEKGMSLAMLKDQNSHQFIKNTLSAISVPTTIYWIGLQRMVHEGGWSWLDGSPLGEYKPWNSNPYDFWPGVSCAQISGNTKEKYDFVADECEVLTTTNRYVPLCERKLIP